MKIWMDLCKKMNMLIERFKEDQSGIGVVEIILILVILVAIVLIFKNQIYEIISSAFDSISVNTDTIVN